MCCHDVVCQLIRVNPVHQGLTVLVTSHSNVVSWKLVNTFRCTCWAKSNLAGKNKLGPLPFKPLPEYSFAIPTIELIELSSMIISLSDTLFIFTVWWSHSKLTNQTKRKRKNQIFYLFLDTWDFSPSICVSPTDMCSTELMFILEFTPWRSSGRLFQTQKRRTAEKIESNVFLSSTLERKQDLSRSGLWFLNWIVLDPER